MGEKSSKIEEEENAAIKTIMCACGKCAGEFLV